MNTSLEELYLQYERAIEKQKKIIDEKRISLAKAQKRRDLSEIARLNRYIRLLYEEKLELEGHAIDMRPYLRNMPLQ